ncbi:MAG: hypothetical protein WC846_05300 [Candidatus Gracilibacteria bacterium]|jgi:hypothetical protein
MLTPTDLHLLIGLLSKVTEQKNIDIELGAKMKDEIAKTDRDVDITITYKTENGEKSCIKGIEVKKHTRPLTIEHVEQLCAKFSHIKDVTNRYIVSSSGYTKSALKVCKFYKTTALSFKKWTGPYKIGGIDIQNSKCIELKFIEWDGTPHVTLCATEKSLKKQKYTLFNVKGELGVKEFYRDISTKCLNNFNAKNIDEEKHHLTCEIDFNDRVYVKSETDEEIEIKKAIVDGQVKIKRLNDFDFNILVKESSEEQFVACAITEAPDESLIGFSFTKNMIGFVKICIEDRLKKKILRKKI